MNKETLEILENTLVIEHRNFNNTKNEVLRRIQYGRSDEPICVIGPTGIGKTKLIDTLMHYLVRQQSSGWRKESHPPIAVEAPEPNDNKFPWRSFLEELLEAHGEIDLKGKIDLDKAAENLRNGKQPPNYSRITIGQLVKLLKNRISVFRPVAIFIDECQNLVDGVSESELKANLNRLKNWANQMNTILLLFGTHEAKPLLHINEQLTRRVDPIYFPRYRRDDRDDVLEFARFYKALITDLDLKISPECHDDFFSIYDYSLGTPGLLISWLHKAIAHCIDHKISKISPEILKRNRFSSQKLRTIEQAVKNFEKYIEAESDDFNPSLITAETMDYLEDDTACGSAKQKGPKRASPKRLPRSYKVHENRF